MRKTCLGCLLLFAAAGPACAQTASEALDNAWVDACAEAVPGTAFYDRCQEILNGGPGSGARRSAAAIGNNLEIFAAQARLMMRMARMRGRAAVRGARQAGDEASGQSFRLLDADPEGKEPETIARGSRWDLFGSASLSNGTHHDTGFERGYGDDGHSLLLGGEMRWNRRWSSLLGLQRERSKVEFAGGTGRLDSHTDQATLALNYTGAKSFAATLSLSAGRLHSQLQRQIAYTLTLDAGQPNERQITIHSRGDSENSASTRGADLDAGWDRGVGAWSLHYGAGYSWQRTEVERIVEDNAVGLDFLIVAQKVQSQRLGVEFQAARAFSVAYGVWQPYLRLHWLHEYGDDPRRVFAFFRGGKNVFRLGFGTGAPDRDFGEASIGVIGVFPHGWQAYAGWQRTIANDQLDEDRFDVGWRREF